MSAQHQEHPTNSVIEQRSIDWVPLSERRGKVWHQGPFWFTGNFVLSTLVVGFTGPALGLSVPWTLAAVVLGVAIGTFFMAFHASQGPRMGLPQMIQSRAQFGSRGAIVPMLATIFVYIGFIVFGLVFLTETVNVVLPGQKWLWYPVFALIAVVIAVVGHDLLHFVQRWLVLVMVAAFLTFTVLAAVDLTGEPLAVQGGWSLSGFVAMLSIAAGYQISYAVYVSDYSRYLPSDTPTGAVVGWTFLGASLSAIWLMALGAFLASRLETPQAVGSLVEVGNGVVPELGTILILLSIPSQIGIMAVNTYGAMLTSATVVDGFTRIRATRRTRVVGIVLIMAVAVAVALSLPTDYLDSFNTFVILMLYFLIPWTAVNLVDFYLVRRGDYAIAEIFERPGIYGAWAWRGLVAYTVGLLAMVPFVIISFYTGPVAAALGDVDVSFVIGLVVSGILYYLLNLSVDRRDEKEAIARSRVTLEDLAGVRPEGGPATAAARS